MPSSASSINPTNSSSVSNEACSIQSSSTSIKQANYQSSAVVQPTNILGSTEEIPTESEEIWPPTEHFTTVAQVHTPPDELISHQINLISKRKFTYEVVKLKLAISNRESILLIDSGASVSIIKKKMIRDIRSIDRRGKALLKGIGKEATTTLGCVSTLVDIPPHLKIPQKFQVVEDEFPIEQDGILGRDFLSANKVDILYSTSELRILGTKIKFLNNPAKITLPPREEVIVQIETPSDQQYLCNSEEVVHGVYVGNCLIQPNMLKAQISMVNTNPNEVTIENFVPKLTSLDQYDILKLNSNLEAEKNRHFDHRGDLILEQVIPNLDENLNMEEITSLLELIKEYSDIFFIEGDKLSSVPGVKHQVHLHDNTPPINTRQYRVPQVLKKEIDTQVQKMLDDNIVTHSTSPFNSPLLVVPKKPDKNGKVKWRVVVDFRRVNEATIGDSYPLPLINDIFDQLGHSQYFSTLDMASGYHQIEMDPQDRHKTAFSTDYGHFEFLRMPFGMKNSQSTFQRMINSVLLGQQGLKCFVYLDDVIVYGRNLRDHNSKLRDIFEAFRRNNLKIQTEKCQFLSKEIQYLGHIITPEGIKPNPKTVEAIVNFPVPRNMRETKSFLGLASYYRKFVPAFSTIAEPLHKLTRKKTKFEWSEKCQTAFDCLKSKMVTTPILQYPDFDRVFILTTDASDYGVGAILSQIHDGNDLPVAYASRSLKPAEKNYSTIEKEMLATKWAVEVFRPYLFGRKFTIRTDHKPLIGDLKNASKRILKWRLQLAEYDYNVVHVSGKTNTGADALSRIKEEVRVITRAQAKEKASVQNGSNADEEEIIPQNIPIIPEIDDPVVGQPKSSVQIVTDPKVRLQILHEKHDLPLGGHAGVFRTYKRIRMDYYWPNMLNEIKKYVSKCKKCKQNKSSKRTKVPLVITKTAEYPFQRVALDIVGPLPTTDAQNKYLLTFQDDLTKFSGAIPLPDEKATTVAKALCEQYITKLGAPEKILTDMGTNFMSNLFESICKLLKIKHITTTSFHPQTNGALERSHNTLKEYLRNFADIDHTNWDEMVHYAMFVYNTTPHCSTNFTPYELVFGRPALVPTAVKKEPQPTYNYDDYVSELKARLRLAHHVARLNILKNKEKAKISYDKNTSRFQVANGDLVWVRNEMRKTKQDPIWLGPYPVVKVLSPTNTIIQVKGKNKNIHNNRLKKD